MKSAKLSNQHFNLITLINEELMYGKVMSEAVPFFQWQKWIDTVLQREIMQMLFSQNKDKQKTGDPKKKPRKSSTTQGNNLGQQKAALKSFITETKKSSDKSSPSKQPQSKVPTFAPTTFAK